MPHRLNVFFSHFFMKFYFLAFKNLKKRKILKTKITAIFFYQFVLNHPLLQIIWFTDMKVRSYARDMHFDRKDEKKYVEIQKKKMIFLRKQNGENYFHLVQM